jgi:cytochrome c-type biogenesis protein CcmF
VFNREVQKEVEFVTVIQIARYDLHVQGFDTKAEKNYTADRLIIEVMKAGKPLMMLYPERRNFPANQENGTMVAIASSAVHDLYVVYAGRNPETGLPVVHVYLNPLVKWIWFGGMVVVFGTLVALLPNRRTVLVVAGGTQPVTSTPGLTPALAQRPALKEGHD